MREEFRTNLLEIRFLLVDMAQGVRSVMIDATTALLDADKDLAVSVIARDMVIDELRGRVEDLAYETTVRQAPVASDLRMLFTALHVAADLERMGDLAEHVARVAERHHPQTGIPTELRNLFGQMARVAGRMAGNLAFVLATPDTRIAAELDCDDDAMDRLHQDLLQRMLQPDWSHSAQTSIDAALVGRFYERYGDHAANAGRQVMFLLSGEPVRS